MAEDHNAGRAYIEVVPSLKDFQKRAAAQMRQAGIEARKAYEDGFSSAKAGPAPTPDSQAYRAKGREAGVQFAGAFDKEVRTKVTAALKSLPNVDIDADSSPAQKEIAQIRASLERLSNQRIGVDIDEATALNRLETLQRKLAEISASDNATIAVKANTSAAALELDKIRVAAERVGAMSPTVTVDADTAGAQAQMAALSGTSISASAGVSGLVATGLMLGPALVPGAAAATSALVALGAAGGAAATGIGVAVLAFGGIPDAVKATISAEDNAAKDSEAASARRVASARQIESAQESLASAEQSAADASVQSARAVRDAQQGVVDARRSAADGVQAALDRVRSAEDAETQAVRDAKTAQDALNTARADAKRALADLQMQLRDGELSEEQASISLERARQRLEQPFKSGIDKRQAQLDFKQAEANLDEIRVRNKRLAAEKKKADRDGIEGTDGVRAAQQQLIDAQQRQKDASSNVADAEKAVLKAREDGANKVAAAQQKVSDAMAAQSRSAQRSADQVTRAQEQLSRAHTDAAASADKSSASQAKAAGAMAGLSPAGRKFATFILGMRGGLKDLRDDAATGFLPGLQKGMQEAGKALSPFRGIVKSTAREMGSMATSAGKGLGGPEFRNFFAMVKKEGGPTLRLLGGILGNLSKSFAGLAVAFAPIAKQVLTGLESLTARFADFANEGQGGGLSRFVDYLRTNGPKVATMVGSLARAFGQVVQAIAPFGEWVVAAITRVSDGIAGMPVGQLRLLLGAVVGLTLAWKAATLVARGVQTVDATITAGKRLQTLWTNRETAATLRSTIATKAKTVATKAAAVAQRLLNLAMRMNPIGMIITALVALGTGLVILYKKHEGFRNVVNRAWASIQRAAMSVVGWFRNTALPWMRGALTSIGNAGKWLWQKALGPAFRGIGAVITWWYRNIVRRYFTLVGTVLRGAGRVGMWLWRNALAPAFRGIGAVATWLFSKVIRPIFSRITTTFRGAAIVAKWLYRNGIRPAFQSIGDKAGWLWDKAQDVFDKLKSGIRAVKSAFSSAKTGIGKAWGGLKDAISKPILAALKWIDDHFIAKVKQLLNAVGLGGKGGLSEKVQYLVKRADGGRIPRRAGGGVIPGPWRGPTADNVLGISDDGIPVARVNPREYITRVWATDRMERKHPGALAYINRHGELPGHAEGGAVAARRFAKGGMVFPAMVSWLKKSVPGAYVTSTNGGKHAAGSNHYANRAIDIGGSAEIMRAAAAAIQRTFGSKILELIHNPGFSVKNGKKVGAGLWGAQTWGNHRNHVHWAMSSMDGKGGGSLLGGLLSGFAAKVADGGKEVLTGILDKMPAGKSFWGQVTTSPMRSIADGVFTKFKEAASMMGGGDDSGVAPGKGVERWRPMVLKALGILGMSDKYANSTLRRMMQESGGNPRAINNWDSNAKRGTPSKGLMQVIDPTFRAYAMQGYKSNIWDPLSNILASMRYAVAAYGNLFSAYNRKGGYHDGGQVTGYAGGVHYASPGLHWVGENGPELRYFRGGETVIPNHRSRQLAQGPAAGMRIAGQVTIPGFGRGYIEGVVEDVVNDMNDGAAALAGMGRS